MSGTTPWPSEFREYIEGHLSNFAPIQIGESSAGPVTFDPHLDTLIMSWAMAVLMVWGLSRASKGASAKNPTRWQVCCEMLFSFFDNQVRGILPNAPRVVGPLAITIFVWVFLMNSLDLVPVDLVATSGHLLTGSVPHFKVLPVADLSLTAAMAISVFAITMYYNIKIKGVGGFLHEIAAAPFGIAAAPANILLRIVEELARPLSLAMRLFGNLFAAEVIFLLIGGGISFAILEFEREVLQIGEGGEGLLAFSAQWIFGAPWAIYHILVVPLQAYIFAVLTVVYIGMAHEKH